MPETSSGTPPDKLSIVVYDRHFDKVHYALVMASAAAAIGTPATLFFTMDACQALMRDDGWKAMPLSDGDGNGAGRDADYAASKVATFDELLSACAALNVRFLICEMGLRARGMDRAGMRDDVEIEEGGVVTFLMDASSDGAMIFI